MDDTPDVPPHRPDPALPGPITGDRPRSHDHPWTNRPYHPGSAGGIALRAEQVAARHSPAYVVVDANYDVQLFSRRTGRFLEPAAGAATLALLSLVHRDLRLDLAATLHRASATGRVTRAGRLPMTSGDRRTLVSIVVEPVAADPDDAARFVVLFQDTGPEEDDNGEAARALRTGQVQRLEAALNLGRERLQTAVEALETTNEELKTSNEEHQSVNEELQSTNEELETSKEGLQSVNEEMQIVNGELVLRVAELAHANSDLKNVLESTQIAVVFLDNDLNVKSFTPAVTEMFRLTEGDIGRPITDIAARIPYPEMVEDVRRVLRTLGTVKRELGAETDGQRFLIRVLPYRSVDNVIAGAVLTFLDITAATRAAQALGASEERFRMMARIVPAFLFTARPDLGWDYVNPRFYEFTGLTDGSALGDGWLAALHPEDAEENQRRWQQAARDGSAFGQEYRMRGADGAWRWFLGRALPQRDEAGAVVRWFGSSIDIHERRQAEARQQLLLAELQHRVKNILAVVRSVMTRTMEAAGAPDMLTAHLSGRIGALARTQAVLARTGEGAVPLEELVRDELAAHGGQDERQYVVEGPALLLGDKSAEILGLALHELVTNALKYGALSTPGGRLLVQWRVYAGGRVAHRPNGTLRRLILEWEESGVPITDLEPGRTGFGRELIEQGLPYELGASTSLTFRPGGVRCVIELPLDPRTGGASVGER